VVDLTLLSHALTLAKHGTYARAAEALRISQPALSRQIAALEGSLGVRLFDRSRKGISPTAFGRVLLHRATFLVLEASDFERNVALLQELKDGELKVGAGVYPAELSLGTAVGRLAARHPGLRIDITAGDWRDAIEGVLAAVADLAVVELSVIKDDARLVLEPLPPHDGVFYCRPGHPLLAEKDLTVERVFDYPFAGPKLAPRVASLISRALKGKDVDPSTGDYLPSIKVDTLQLAKDAVAASNAFGIAPATAISSEVALGRLVTLPIRPSWLHTSYGFAWLKNRTLSPAALAFMAEVRTVEAELLAQRQIPAAIVPAAWSTPADDGRVAPRAASGRRR
jgi:DNA-binding transcriptional LysR family regulator